MDLDGLFVLGALIVLAIPVGVIVLFVKLAKLKARVGLLESALQVAREAGTQADAPSIASPAPKPKPEPEPEPEPEPSVDPGPAPVSAVLAPLPASAAPSPWTKAVAAASRQAPGPADAPSDTPSEAAPSRAVVMRSDLALRLVRWLRENWVYAISAISLALAGIFLVQYGIERGLLPPALRVGAGAAFGLALVVAGEFLRRRFGDDPKGNVAYLPATFSGAGVVSTFAAIVAAHQMYGLIGPEAAFAAQGAVALLAVALGWYNGALLVAVGLIGAAASPFIVSSTDAAGPWLYAYFALIAATGLAVDTVRRWAWVSALALVLGYGGGWLSLMSLPGITGFVALMAGLPILASLVPERGWLPRQEGPALTEFLLARNARAPWPTFPVRLVLGSVLVSAIGLFLQASGTTTEAMLVFGALTLLALAYLIWARDAPGLADIALIPALLFVIGLGLAGLDRWTIAGDFADQAAALRAPETSAPMTVSLLVAMAAAMSAAFAFRALVAGPLRRVHGLAAALTAPVAVAVMELTWAPAGVLGPYPWALHVMALAAAMVVLAMRFAAVDGADRRRMAHATLSALSLVALALFILTSAAALTLALAVLIAVAAALDRRFDLAEMGLFVQIGVAVLTWRLIMDPGLQMAMLAPLGQVVVAWGGALAGLGAALWRVRPLTRPLTKAVLESALVGFGALLGNVLITRWLIDGAQTDWTESHWGVALNAMPWLMVMLVQAYRARLGGALRRVRLGLAGVGGVLATGLLLVAAVPLNPLYTYSADDLSGLVRGPVVLDTLALAYGLPAAILMLAALRLPGLGLWARRAALVFGAALGALYLGLEIRRFWRGDWLGAPGVTQAELYTYTLALMLLGAGLLYQAVATRNATLRRLAMLEIAFVIAKVFLIDASGLTGLTRVVSFLGLGLSLAGLAWLNRWVGDAIKTED